MTGHGSRTGWSGPETVTDGVRRAWDRGDILRDAAGEPGRGGQPVFPLEVPLRGPRRGELVDRFGDVAEWARVLRADSVRRGWRLEDKRVPSRLLGPQQLPTAAWVDEHAVALVLLGHAEQEVASRFRTALVDADAASDTDQFRQRVRSVALARPLDVAAAAEVWPSLVAVARWLDANPRPGVGLRDIPVRGAHTKLLEQNRPLARALFDAVLPPTAVDTGAGSFEGRYGFATGAMDVLLAGPGVLLGVPWREQVHVTWPLDALAGVDLARLPVTEVVIVENKASLARVPVAEGRMTVWGAGYAAEAIGAACGWWRQVAVRYWGDVDTHGLLCLARVLRRHRHVTPLLMDECTLLAHRDWWGVEDEPADPEDCEQLLPEPQAELLAGLRSSRWAARLRLEQEHLQPAAVTPAFARHSH